MKLKSGIGKISSENVHLFTQIPHHLLPDQRILEEIRSRSEKNIFFSSKILTDDYFRNKIVIDAGCGCGIKSLAIASKGAKVYGIDGSKTQIDRANRYCRTLNLKAEFIEGFLENFSNLIIKNSIPSPDLIICTAAIHHLSNYESVIEQLSRVLKPGGHLYLSWADPTIAFGGLIIKNQIAYRLGWNMRSRLFIGRSLFGWWDIKSNHMNVDPDSYFADLYCAYYVPIRPSGLLRITNSLGLELCESFPPLYSKEFDSSRRCGVKKWMTNLFVKFKYFFNFDSRPRLTIFKKII